MENKHQIFDDSFENTWKSFDESFRKSLLEEVCKHGSIHRLSYSHEEQNAIYSNLFYEALEKALTSGQFITKWKKALTIPMPKNMDELTEIFNLYIVYPLHAFYLLVLYVHEYPMRAFFSGRDRMLPFNTITLKFQQSLGDPLPTGVDYEFDMIQLDLCPALAYDHEMLQTNDIGAGNQGKPKPHPQHHWKDLIWVWHF